MESLGEKLKEARINKGYSLDQIAQETYISKRFVAALEVEDFSVFPGETYLIGFLRNYAEYLGLDSESLITLYKNIKIQEQPLPMDELIHGKKPLPFNYILILAVVGVLLLGGGTTLLLVFNGRDGAATTEAETGKALVTDTQEQKTKEFYLKEISLTDEFKTGDQITVPFGEDKLYKIEVGPIEKDMVTFILPGNKKIKIQVNKAETLEFNGVSDSKLKINLNNVLSLGGLNNKINISLTKLGAQMSPQEQEQARAESRPTPAAGSTPAPTRLPAQSAAPTTSSTAPLANDTAGETVLAQNEQPRLFTVRAEFNNDCFLRYLIDGKTTKEQLFQKNSNLLIDTSYQSLKIWASNAGAVKLKIEGLDLSLGRQGQIVTKIIRWVKEADTNRYKLVLQNTP